MFELIKTVPLLFRISLIPCAEISVDNFTDACIWPGQGLSGNSTISGNSINTLVRLFEKIAQ